MKGTSRVITIEELGEIYGTNDGIVGVGAHVDQKMRDVPRVVTGIKTGAVHDVQRNDLENRHEEMNNK